MGRDALAEATESDEELLHAAARYMESAPRVTTRSKVPTTRQTPEQLPVGCVGAACLIRTRLQQLAEKCGSDRKCWADAMNAANEKAGEAKEIATPAA